MENNSVITGVGVIAPNGIGKEEFWQNLRDGRSNFKPISLFDTKDLKVNLAGEVIFNPKEILPTVNARDLDRATILLSCAAKLALSDAGFEITDANSKQAGVSVGTTFGSLYSISEFDKEAIRDGPKYANPSVFTSTVGNSPASRISIIFHAKGFNSTISTGMCAFPDALDYSRDFLALKRIKIVITGTVEVLSPQIFLGFYKLNYLAGLKAGKQLLSCPFDKKRNGIVLSEGSAVVLVEDKNLAKERKAKVYAEVLGTGSSFDPFKSYKYDPRGKGMARAMILALRDAGLEPKDIDCIFANANSTPEADLIETKAIKEVFKDYAHKIPVTAIKSIIGETYSASGGMALVAAIGSLANDFIPGTMNLENKDSECDLDYVPNKSRDKKISKVMINTFSPNGENSVIIIGRPS
ncbi:MAG: beta-ketoacyl-[acyl-carrier-protein] synthase family protein [Candidatus Omnitrophica bacterium]|nr:beta-ketoacyl-[acyl-carrier-protein] synthase family protein [Candidatus Omnitrophota bacterium]MBU1869928.1 beta-ketoacyl-[acyl-carrier-protein] synthase family protein [Candidatus Omnitrophota bacterium]